MRGRLRPRRRLLQSGSLSRVAVGQDDLEAAFAALRAKGRHQLLDFCGTEGLRNFRLAHVRAMAASGLKLATQILSHEREISARVPSLRFEVCRFRRWHGERNTNVRSHRRAEHVSIHEREDRPLPKGWPQSACGNCGIRDARGAWLLSAADREFTASRTLLALRGRADPALRSCLECAPPSLRGHPNRRCIPSSACACRCESAPTAP